jgi:hypothetical protein
MQTIYDGLARSRCWPDCSCEAYWSSWLLQPVSVITSLPYIALGLWILLREREVRLKLLGYCFLVAGLGSVAIHASYTRFGEILDFLGIALVSAWFLCLNVLGSRPAAFVRMFWSLHAAVFAILILNTGWKYPLIYLLNSLWIAWIVFGGRTKQNKPLELPLRQLILGLGPIALGFVLFQIDNRHLWCPEQTWIQGHNLWHLLGFSGNAWLYFRVFKPTLTRQN